ncbi:MAG: type II toxin-antitoxin system PemK/MazF family toxin [Propionibacterium sp.]|nr:type II toxin-antitoxin system PemK/MazF family toxin [Propionibacterium sp.]
MNRTISRGDVVWANMDPTIGREQAKHRPWLVLSEPPLHRARGLLIAVPLTHTDRGWSTHVNLTPGETTATVAMCEQVKSMSITRVTRVDPMRYPMELVDQTHEILALLTGGR